MVRTEVTGTDHANARFWPRKMVVELYSKADEFGVRLLKPHKACSKWTGWTACGASHCYGMVAPAAALVGLNRSDLCRDNRSCSVPGSATERASGVLSGIFVHQAAESSYCVEN